MTVEKELTMPQQKLLSILPTIGACLSIICCIRLIVRVVTSPYASKRLYHRLMVGCSLSCILQSVQLIFGPYAVPAGTPNFAHARGTVTTCTATGFIGQLTLLVVPSYYFCLTVLAFLSVGRKQGGEGRSSAAFRVQNYIWMEPYLHLAVYIFPLASSVYLLTEDAYNPVIRHCAVASVPLGCGDQSETGEVLCTRGPQDIGWVQWVFAALPALILILFPTALLILLYCRIRTEPIAASVAKQSASFLFVAIYWTYLFSAIDAVLVFQRGELVFVSNLLANLMYAMQGVWILCVYWYFRSDDPTMRPDDRSTTFEKDGTRRAAAGENGNDRAGPWSDATSNTSAGNQGNNNMILVRPDFSIFDGSSRFAMENSPWSEYLKDEGEDEDYQNNCEYTDKEFGIAQPSEKKAMQVVEKVSED